MAEEDDVGETAAGEDSAVQAASFPDLAGVGGDTGGIAKPNLDLIRDIQVTLTVELGRTDMVIEEVMGLTPGKVIELDKLAGEPLDILINGKLLAKGEVVVVDENFGIRITSIVDPRARVQAIGGGDVDGEADGDA
ncbi:MAG: flagellar motor switch protein FliN [Planctomycetota bacterium]|nr:MAG: flagellar motor switch protein FliN [Planctomycetota bacterium]